MTNFAKVTAELIRTARTDRAADVIKSLVEKCENNAKLQEKIETEVFGIGFNFEITQSVTPIADNWGYWAGHLQMAAR